jgi:hypothetical protein
VTALTASGKKRKDDTTVRESAQFRQTVQRPQTECRQRGLVLPAATAENVLEGAVGDVAGRLSIEDESVVRATLDGFDVGPLADLLVRARTARQQEVADTSPAVLDIASTGRLVASLAQAIRCVRLNHRRLADERDDHRYAIAVLDDASNGLTLIGEALEHHHIAPQGSAVFWSAESVVHTRRALSRTVANLQSGSWSFGYGPELDTGAATRIQTSLTLLPEQ